MEITSLIVTAIATCVMAIVTAVIACTNKKQLNALIFKERYSLYTKITNYVSCDHQHGSWEKLSDDKVYSIHKSIYILLMDKSKFVFGDDIFNHLKKYENTILQAKLAGGKLRVTSQEDSSSPFEKLQILIQNETFTKPFLKYLKSYPK